MSSGLSLLNLSSASVLESAAGHSDLSVLNPAASLEGELPQGFSQLMTKMLAQQGNQVGGDTPQVDPVATHRAASELGQSAVLSGLAVGLKTESNPVASQVALDVSWSDAESIPEPALAELLTGLQVDVVPVDPGTAETAGATLGFPNGQIDTDPRLLDWAASVSDSAMVDEPNVKPSTTGGSHEGAALAGANQLQDGVNAGLTEVLTTGLDSSDLTDPVAAKHTLSVEVPLAQQQNSVDLSLEPMLSAHSPATAVAQPDTAPVATVPVATVQTVLTEGDASYVFAPAGSEPEQAWTLTQLESDQQLTQAEWISQDAALADTGPESTGADTGESTALSGTINTVASGPIAPSANAERLATDTAAAKSSYSGAWLSTPAEGIQLEEGSTDDLHVSLASDSRRTQSTVPAALIGEGRSLTAATEASQATAEGIMTASEEVASFDEVLEGFTSKNALKLIPTAGAAVTGASGANAVISDPKLTANPIMQFSVTQSVNTPSWGNEVTDKVMWMASQGLSEAEIQLDPPELGPLQARVTVNQDQAQVVFTSHSAQVREALDQQATRLREMFAGEGLDLTNVDVSDQQTNEHQQRDGTEPVASHATDTEQDALPMESTPAGVMSQYLVDQYV